MNKARTSALQIRISGPLACFRRPEFARDMISYDVMPPTVARRIVASVAALVGGEWRPERIYVLKPIQLRWDTIATARGTRRALVLTNVDYVIEAMPQSGSVDRVSNANELNVRLRGLEPHLGLSDFRADLKIITLDDRLASPLFGSGIIDLGWMLFDTIGPKHGQFFRASLNNGIMELSGENIILAS